MKKETPGQSSAHHPIGRPLDRVRVRHGHREQIVLAQSIVHVHVERARVRVARREDEVNGADRRKGARGRVGNGALHIVERVDRVDGRQQIERVQLVRHGLDNSDDALRGEARVRALGGHTLRNEKAGGVSEKEGSMGVRNNETDSHANADFKGGPERLTKEAQR